MMETRLNRLYERYGYRRFKMSKFEPYDFYAANRDFLTSSQLITFTDLDGSLLALKPDVTLSIVKSNGGGEEKVYYNEMVYRPKDRHFREIMQAGIECIGSIDAYAEGEAVYLAAKSLWLFSEDYVIRISDATFIKELLEAFGVPNLASEEVLKLFASKNSEGIRQIILKSRENSDSSDLSRLFYELSDLYLPFGEGISLIEERLNSLLDEKSPKAVYIRKRLKELKNLSHVLEAFAIQDRVFLDFSVANSMDYYNGILFQGAIKGIPFTVLSGGRYDRLMEKMEKRVGAIGFAIYMDMISDYSEEERLPGVDILMHYNEEEAVLVPKILEKLLNEGKRVRVIRREYLEKMEQKLRFKESLSLLEAAGRLDKENC